MTGCCTIYTCNAWVQFPATLNSQGCQNVTYTVVSKPSVQWSLRVRLITLSLPVTPIYRSLQICLRVVAILRFIQQHSSSTWSSCLIIIQRLYQVGNKQQCFIQFQSCYVPWSSRDGTSASYRKWNTWTMLWKFSSTWPSSHICVWQIDSLKFRFYTCVVW